MSTIYNMRGRNGIVPAGAVLVDRSSDWGNPFVMHGEADRDRVCDLFADYAQWRVARQPDWLEPLRGKDLACWCAPKRCHVETLRELANRPVAVVPPSPEEVERFLTVARAIRDELALAYLCTPAVGLTLPWDGDWIGIVAHALRDAHDQGRGWGIETLKEVYDLLDAGQVDTAKQLILDRVCPLSSITERDLAWAQRAMAVKQGLSADASPTDSPGAQHD